MLQYSDGDDCPGSTLHKKTTLFSFECDQSKPKTVFLPANLGIIKEKQNPPEFVAEMNNCTYWFQWKTPIACPTKIVDNVGGGGGGGESSNVAKWYHLHTGLEVLIIRIIIVGLIYFLGGILLKRFLYNAYGIEQIPHYTFWRGIIIFLRVFFFLFPPVCPLVLLPCLV